MMGRLLRRPTYSGLLCTLLLSAGCTHEIREEIVQADCMQLTPHYEGTTTTGRISVILEVASCLHQPIDDLRARDFALLEDGERVPELGRTGVVRGIGESGLTNMLFLLDVSGSLVADGRLPEVADAIQPLLRRKGAFGFGLRTALYVYDGALIIRHLLRFSDPARSVEPAMHYLSEITDYAACAASEVCLDPSTNFNGAVVSGQGLLELHARTRGEPYRLGTMVLITDTFDRASRVKLTEARHAVGRSIHQSYVIAIGDQVDRDALESIGFDGIVYLSDVGRLDEALTQIRHRARARADRFVSVEYCSPRRSGQHTLMIEARHRNEVGRYVYRFDASGFTPGCALEARTTGHQGDDDNG